MLCRIFSHVMAPSSTNLPLISSSSSASAAAFRGETWPEHRTGISFSAAGWFCCWSSSSLHLGVSQVMSLWVTISPGKGWLHLCGSGQVGFTSFLCYEEVLFCIAVHDSFFLICTCLKFIERGIFFQSMSGGFVVDCWLCLWKSHFSDLTALHSATSARAPLILSWPRWFKMNVLSKQSEAKLPLRWVRGENLGKGNEHPKHKEIIVFSFSTIRFPGWWAL